MPCPQASQQVSRALCLGWMWPRGSCSKQRKICARKSENQKPESCRNPFFIIKTLPVSAIHLIYCSILLTRMPCLMSRELSSPMGSWWGFQVGILHQALLRSWFCKLPSTQEESPEHCLPTSRQDEWWWDFSLGISPGMACQCQG